MSTKTEAKTAAPAAKKVPVKAPAKSTKKVAAKGGGRILSTLGDKKIKLLVKENPKREGTAAHKEFAIYKNGMKVSDAIAKGLTTVSLRWDEAHGFISIG